MTGLNLDQISLCARVIDGFDRGSAHQLAIDIDGGSGWVEVEGGIGVGGRQGEVGWGRGVHGFQPTPKTPAAADRPGPSSPVLAAGLAAGFAAGAPLGTPTGGRVAGGRLATATGPLIGGGA